MEKEHLEECPVCGQKKFSEKFFCEDHFVSHEKFAVCRCNACRFTFTQDIPSGESMAQYYASPDYISHSDTKKGPVNSLYHAVRKRMIHRKMKLVEKNSPVGRLLDIGCGTGYFAGTMKQQGREVIGIEPSPAASEIARSKFGLDVRPAEALFEIPEKHVGTITLWHVLEHLINLNESMARFHKILDDNGTLIIAVPNIDSYDARKYRQYWAAYDVPRHIWHFSPETLNITAKKHGFKITDINPMPFDAFYISMLSEKYKGNKLSAIRGLVTGLIAYFVCLFDKKKSSSLIYILNKT